MRDKLQICSEKFYDNFSRTDRLNLLKYCLSDNQENKYEELAGIYLLPLANEMFIAFKTLCDADFIYLCSPAFPRKLLPKLVHKLVDLHEADPELQAKLMIVAKSHKTQLRELDVHSVASLLTEAMPVEWKNKKEVTFSNEDFQFSWFEDFWKWVKDHPNLDLFKDKLVLPVETTDPKTDNYTVIALCKDHPILYIPFFCNNCSSDMLSAICKLGIHYCSHAKFHFVDHQHLTQFVKIYSNKAVLEALALKDDCSSIKFSPQEAECLRNSFASIPLSQKNKSVLRSLRIFSTCVNTSQYLYSPLEVQSSQAVVVEPSSTIDLKALPSDIIVFSSENSNQTLLLKKLGYEKSNGVDFVCSHILPKVSSMNDEYIDGIMTQVLNAYQSCDIITTAIEKLPFVKTDLGSRKCPTELFNPDNKSIQVIYWGEKEKFPDKPYNNDKYIGILIHCGLRNALTPEEVLGVISSIGLPATKEPKSVGMTEWSRAVGIIKYISSSEFSLTDADCSVQNKDVSFPANLKMYSDENNWIPVLSERPDIYPSCLPWKGEEYSSHFISLKGPVCVSSTSSSNLPLLYGSQVFFTYTFDYKLKWDEPVHCLVPHLIEVIKAHEDLEPEEMMSILEKIYFALQELVDSVNYHHLDQLKSLQSWVYIKKHHHFVGISNIALKRNPTFDHDVEPYLYIIPDSISNYTKLFKSIGMQEEVTESQIVSILGVIKNRNFHDSLSLEDDRRRIDADRMRIVVAILNWLTNNGTKYYDTSKYGEQVYVPVESISGELDLREPSEVVFVDNEFLKNTSESEGLVYVHNEINQNLAKCLHIVPLSEQLGISEDTFEDAGQSEPLIVRLQNILSDYKDGLPIMKELVQNADDAEATEVNICYDRRSHAIVKDMLFFPGMSLAHGPALIVHNNSTFRDEDFINIQKLAAGTKQNNHKKIGKFGTGFCSVYHITDVPSFISRNRLYIFDPTLTHLKEAVQNEARPGKKVNFRAKFFSQSKQLEPYDGLFGFNSNSEYAGTLFRFPFRTSESKLSSALYSDTQVRKLLNSLQECGENLLLFLRHVKKISVYEFDEDKDSPEIVYCVCKPAITRLFSQNDTSVEVTEIEQLGDSETTHSWVISNYENEQEKKLASVACRLIKNSNDSYSVSSKLEGEAFCFLPLSQSTGLPIHVSCNFALTSNRQGLWTSKKDTTAGDFQEVQWNASLMEKAIPMACKGLFNALKGMVENDVGQEFKLQDYKFYSLWPLLSSLKQHNPWSQFVVQLYKELSTCKLFYSESRAEWKHIKDSKFLEPNILSMSTATPECVLQVLDHLKVVVVDLPVRYREYLELNDSLISQSDFIDWFFSHLMSFSDILCHRNEVVLLLLELLASDCASCTHTLLKERLETTTCIPCSPDGMKLKMANRLIHPKSPFAELYEPEESMAPLDSLIQKRLVEVALNNLGIINKVMPLEYVIERAKTIPELFEADSEKAYARIKLIVEAIALNTDGYSPLDISSIKFLPVMKKPDEFSFPWPGCEVELCCGKELLRPIQTHISISGSQSFFLDETKLRDRECFFTKSVEEILGLKSEPLIFKVVAHFELVIQSVTEKLIDIPLICANMYEFFESKLNKKQYSDSDNKSLEQLKQLPCIWTGKTFIYPDQVSFKWSLNGPYLYCVPDILVSKKSLCSFLCIKETFSAADVKKAMLKMKEDCGDQPVDDLSKEVIRHTLTLLEKFEDDESGFILPARDYSLHNAEDLAYNDAPWASVEDSYVYVHENISRTLATKLGVKLVRSKFLDEFTSKVEFKWNEEGKSFGQHEELTQRIKNILRDYLLDATLLKELIQNADDAKASKVYFILDKRFHSTSGTLSDEWEDLQGPALLVWNDSVFSKDDLVGIQSLGLGSKRFDAETIGQFGIGFNVAYHLTDCPSFVTNGETLCIMDPHRRYVPGANKLSPGRMFDGISGGFWDRFPGMKSPYMRGDSIGNLPPEILKGSLFRFPLRHNKRKVKLSKIIDCDTGNADNDFDHEKFGNDLNIWMMDTKETILFLNNIMELKFYVVEDQGTELKTVLHYKTKIDSSVLSRRDDFQRKLSTFKDGGSCNPCAIMYPLVFMEMCNSDEETKEKKMTEKWLVQQSVGNICHSDQHWKYVSCLKPKHGLAAPLFTEGTRSEFKGRVFSFLPLPIRSGLPIHINGQFILNSSRRDIWWHKQNELYDDLSTWNMNLIHAMSSSYAEFLFQARAHYVLEEEYKKGNTELSTVLSDIAKYYSLFPLCNSCSNQWYAMAYNVYKCIVEKNYKVFCGVKSNPSGTGYVIEWYHSRSSNQAESVYYWTPSDFSDNHEGVYPILERIGMRIVPISPDIVCCFDAALKQCKQRGLLEVDRKSAFEYFTKCSVFSDLLEPEAIDATPFQNVESFVLFTKFLLKDASASSSATTSSYPSKPFSSYLLLTADGFLRKFDKDAKVFFSPFSPVFPESLESFVHPDLLGLNYPDHYFVQPGDSDKEKKRVSDFVLGIIKKNFSIELMSVTIVTDISSFITEDQLRKLWSCFSEDKVFSKCIKEVLQKWAFLLTTDNRLYSISSSILPVEANSNSQICQVLKKLQIPFLNSRVVVAETNCCPKIEDGRQILSNLYYQNLENPIDNILEKDDLIAIINYLSSVLRFSSDYKTHLQSLPLFETIDEEFTHIESRKARKAYIWPLDCCSVAYKSWLQGHDAVFIKAHAEWSQLPAAKELSIGYISPEEIYIKFIFPHFSQMDAEDRYHHLEFIRKNMFDKNLATSKTTIDANTPKGTYDQNKQAVSFVENLKELKCIGEDSSSLKRISEHSDHTEEIFKKFSEDFLFLPEQLKKDLNCLSFFRNLGLQQTMSEKKYIELCEKTAEKGKKIKENPETEECSHALLKLLFVKNEWESDTYRRVSGIEFVMQKKLPDIEWAVPGPYPDRDMVSLDGSAPSEKANLLWTVKAIVQLPVCVEEHEDIAKLLGICVVPSIIDVIQNIDNICKRFSNKELFYKMYPKELTCNSRKHENMMTVMCDNFTYLLKSETSKDGPSLSSANYNDLKSLPCIPVYHTIIARKQTQNKLVFVNPNSVIYDRFGHSSADDFHPYLHSLPEELQSVVEILKDLDVTDNFELRHFQMILEDVFNSFKNIEIDDASIVHLAIKKLYEFLKNHEDGDYADEITPLYLPDIENKMRLSRHLLYYDKKDAFKLNLHDTDYYLFTIPSDFPFSVNELCEVLPDSVRPVRLTSVCEELIMDHPKQCADSSLAVQLRKAINFSELHEGIYLFLVKICSKHNMQEANLKKMIKSCLSKFEIITVAELSTKIVLKSSKKIIGGRKVSFFVDDSSVLYLEDFEKLAIVDDIQLQVANHLSQLLCSNIGESVGEEMQQLSEAIHKCLSKTSGDSVKKVFKNHYEILVQGDGMPSFTGEVGDELPEDWHHRLDQDIAHSFKPREYVAYEDKEWHYIVARIAYQIEPLDEIELNRKYRIYTGESKKKYKDVNGLTLYKFIKCSRNQAEEKLSEDVILFEKNKIWDQLEMFWKVSSDIKHPLICTAIKRLFLKWHPDKNVHSAQNAAMIFTYFTTQLQNAEQHKHLDSPNKEFNVKENYRDHWIRSLECYQNFILWNEVAKRHSLSFNKEESCYCDDSSECGSNGLEISIEVCSFPFDTEDVEMDPKEGERWIKKAENEFRILEFLHKQAGACSACDYVCTMAEELVKKALIGGVYTLCGMDKEDLKEHSLSDFAHVIQSFHPDKTREILKHCETLEKYDQYASHPDTSELCQQEHADHAKEDAEAVIKIVRSIIPK